ncbi:MAG TPA: S41 family peptidase [Bacteroidales bacterium]|nr:S41 family peptidase [Bacteroidales bacterium]
MRSFLFIIIALTFFGCEDKLLKEEFDDTPTGIFNAFWSEFDRFYGAFEAKNINWDSLRIVSAQGLSNSSTDRELYDALCKLIVSLNDGHAVLSAEKFGNFSSWSRRNKSYFADVNTTSASHANQIFSTILTDYLKSNYKSDESTGYLFFYGTFSYNTHKLGYLFIPTFDGQDFPKDFIRKAAAEFQNVDAVIIDLRFNPGGITSNFQFAQNMFTSESRLYLKSRLRNGPKHSDFTGFIEHYTHPDPQSVRNKPIALLANSYTGSSAEHFILGMKSQDNVILVGDTTRGAFSEVHQRVLSNGWVYQLGAQVIYTPDGRLYRSSNGKYIEGYGLAPDYYAPDYLKALSSGNDYPLNRAIIEIDKRIKTGN